jgi:hypothetical protein
MLAHRHYSEQTVDMERVLLLILVGFFVGFFYSTFIFIHFFYFFPFAFLFLSFLCNFRSLLLLWHYGIIIVGLRRRRGPVKPSLDQYAWYWTYIVQQDQYSKTFETVSLFTRCFFFICLPALLTLFLISFLNL